MRATMRKLEMVEFRYKQHEFSPDDARRIRAVRELLGGTSVILDVGCLDGTVADLLRPNKQVSVVGLELSLDAARKAKDKVDNVVVCDVEESLPLRPSCIDCVYAGEIIEHLFDPDYFLEEVKRILGRGCLVLTTPNLAGLGSRVSLLLGRKPWMVEERLKEKYAGHIRYFTVSMLEEMIRDHGLVVDKVTSDGVKLGKTVSRKLGEIFPRLGLHIIIRAQKK